MIMNYEILAELCNIDQKLMDLLRGNTYNKYLSQTLKSVKPK